MGKGGYRYLRILDLNKLSDEEIKRQLKNEILETPQADSELKTSWEKRDHGSQCMVSCCAVVRNRSFKVNNTGAEVTGQKNSKVNDHASCTSS